MRTIVAFYDGRVSPVEPDFYARAVNEGWVRPLWNTAHDSAYEITARGREAAAGPVERTGRKRGKR